MAEVSEHVHMLTKLGYGTGHVLNDIAGSIYFTYVLIFYHDIIQMDNFYAGLTVLLGQIADGVSTVLFGILSDKDNNSWLCTHYGKRKVILEKIF